jgi:hypothetical protein
MAQEKWFHPKKKLNWHADDTLKIRRQNALNSRHGSLIQAAHALQSLSNVSQNDEVRRKSRADAVYFFAQHKKKLALKSKTRRG